MLLLDIIVGDKTPWIAHGVVVFGVLVYLLARFAGAYKIFIVPVALAIVCLGLFFEGMLYGTKQYRAKVAEYEAKVKEAEQKSAEVNTVIQTKVVEKIKVVKENTNANVQIIEKVVTKYDNLCTLSNAAVVLHNSASQNVVAPSSGPTVEGTSNVKASELIRTVTENYGTYYQMREQLLGWQEWYKEQKKIYESVK
jgi:hypothetical protein